MDLRQAEAQEIVRTLIKEADVLIENFRPGTLEGWGLDPEKLLELNPKLIVLRISGYGQTGPYRDKPGFGVVAEAMGGLRHLTAEPGRVPVRKLASEPHWPPFDRGRQYGHPAVERLVPPPQCVPCRPGARTQPRIPDGCRARQVNRCI